MRSRYPIRRMAEAFAIASSLKLSTLTAGGSAEDVAKLLLDKIELPKIEDPLLLDYLLNTIVAKIPFPHLRMELYRRAGLEVHPTTNIMMHCTVLEARQINIGPHCIIGPYTTLDGRAKLTIGENVNVAGHVLTIGGHHDVDSPIALGILGTVTIEDYAWIAMRATILPGVTVGKGAYVAAQALVNRDVEPYTLVGGVPAKKIRDRSHDLTYTLEHFPRWI
ncbi:MAG: acyltransferase [Chloroflexota bacterium]